MKFAKIISVSFAIGLAMVLAACGGGTGTGTIDTGTQVAGYVNWTGSSNGTIVLDGASQQYQVRLSDGVVVASGNVPLNGAIDNGTQLFINGTQVGNVGSTTSTSGSTIAIFRCSDGSNLSFSLSSSQYAWACAGASSNGGGGNSTTTASVGASHQGQSATTCVASGFDQYGGRTLQNRCNVTVEVSFCTTDGLWACRAQTVNYSPTGFKYNDGSTTIAPGATKSITNPGDNGQTIFFMTCSSGVPYIVDFSTPTIQANSTATGICYL